MSKSAVPVVPGKQGQYDIKSDTPKNHACAACLHGLTEGSSMMIEVRPGVRLRLHSDVLMCSRSYRSGLKPDAYAAMMRRGEKP